MCLQLDVCRRGENEREREGGEEGLRQEEMLLHVYLVCLCVCLVVIRTTKIRA